MISLSSKRQTIVALSTTKAELYSIYIASREAAWIRMIIEGLHYFREDSKVIKLYRDNRGILVLIPNLKLY